MIGEQYLYCNKCTAEYILWNRLYMIFTPLIHYFVVPFPTRLTRSGNVG
jgi:hypothetical protein